MDVRPPERTATEAARKPPRDRILLRTGAWGICAVMAVSTLVVAAQGPAASKRIEHVLSGQDETPPSRPIAVDQAQGHDQSIELLQARIDDLGKDRDRLAGRIAALERNLEDMTGSIAKSESRMSAAAVHPAPVVTAAVAPQPPGPAEPAAPALLPRGPIVLDPLATPPAGLASVLPPMAQRPEAKTEPEQAAPEHVAALAPPEAAKRPTPHQHPEFGIELATAPNLEALRQHWLSAKANFGPLLVGLSPVAVRDRHPGSKAVRLVAGPLPNITAARTLCAHVAEMKGKCWPARIDPADVVR